MNKNMSAVLFLVLAAGCSSTPRDEPTPLPMDPARKVSEQECNKSIDMDGGNLKCHEVTEAERRARIAEEERQARARKEAAERAERERLERERAEALAREEAARKQREAEEEAARKQAAAEAERIAAERRRLEAEAARKAEEERVRKEREEAEARARAQAEKEAREAAERECRRLAQERADGRALLVNFVENYGKVEENKGIAGRISAFLARAPKVKPCPPA
jgi:hypothetical protein